MQMNIHPKVSVIIVPSDLYTSILTVTQIEQSLFAFRLISIFLLVSYSYAKKRPSIVYQEFKSNTLMFKWGRRPSGQIFKKCLHQGVATLERNAQAATGESNHTYNNQFRPSEAGRYVKNTNNS